MTTELRSEEDRGGVLKEEHSRFQATGQICRWKALGGLTSLS